MRPARATVALVAIFLAAPWAHAWTVRPLRAFSAGLIAVDARRDVFAAVTMKPWRYQSAVAIVKLGHADGAER